MQKLQTIFNRVQENKKKLKDLKKTYKEALESNEEYKALNEQLKTLKAKKKHIEEVTKQEYSKEFTQMDDLAIDIESDNQLLTDIALSSVTNGESIELHDEYENEYEPLFKVNFKKIK